MDNSYSSLHSSYAQSAEDVAVKVFKSSPYKDYEILRCPSVYCSRQTLALLLCYDRLIAITKGVCGSIVEAGVFQGQGLMSYAKLLSALEPYNYICKVVGFDTFDGNQNLSDLDVKDSSVDFSKQLYKSDSKAHLEQAAEAYDLDRPLGHLSRIELIQGDICNTGPQYVESHPELLCRILHLSMNLYNPTLSALKTFYPRMPKGGVVAVHAVNFVPSPTKALTDFFGSENLPQIKVIDFNPNFVYFVK